MKFGLSEPIQHFGACDGSAGSSVGSGHFIGATDEKNTLNLYSTKKDSKGLGLLDLNPQLGFAANAKGKFAECDIEGASRIADRIYWIASHAANSEGKRKKERRVFFATQVIGSGSQVSLQMVGSAYQKLLVDLVNTESLSEFGLDDASKRPPKEMGALNIESLCAADGTGENLYIGFRNPIINGKALVVPLKNAAELVEEGGPAQFGPPILLNLEGLGIRDMVWWEGRYLVIGGDYRDRFAPDAKPSRLFSWSLGNEPVDLKVDFGDLNPEALIVMPDRDSSRVLILSDDGALSIDGVPMKQRDEAEQSFRSAWLCATSDPPSPS